MPSKQSNFAFDFLVGGLCGTLAHTATAPITHVRLVTSNYPSWLAHNMYTRRYGGVFDCFRRICAEQGILCFWRGNLATVIRTFPVQAFNFAFRDKFKSLFQKYEPSSQYPMFVCANIASGAMAGIASYCLIYPIDYARGLIASEVGTGRQNFTGVFDCLRKTMRGSTGFLGLYKGFGISVLCIIPYRGVYFGMFDSLVVKNPYQHDSSLMRILCNFAIAQLSVIAAGYASYPIDTVRRCLQMQTENHSALDCFRKIVKEKGWRTLYKGVNINLVKRTLSPALMLLFYSEVQDWLLESK